MATPYVITSPFHKKDCKKNSVLTFSVLIAGEGNRTLVSSSSESIDSVNNLNFTHYFIY